MIRFIKSAALGLSLCAMPALAQPALTADGRGAAKDAAISAEKADAKASKPKKYCLRFEEATGSHLAKQECKTRAQWEQLDIQVPAEK